MVSVLGLGCNNFGMRLDEQASAAVIEAALDAGITHFDTAEMYGQGRSEEFIGRTLGTRRDRVVIATKYLPRPKDEAYTPGALRARILEACEGSLRRLQTDRIDLYYSHYVDRDAPVDEAVETLEELVRAGKVLHIASSNTDAANLEEMTTRAASLGAQPICAAQMEWSLLQRTIEADIVPTAARLGLGVVPYFPLASGLLTGKYRRGEPFAEGTRLAAMPGFASSLDDARWDLLEQLLAFAEARGRPIIDLAFGWLLAQPGVASVIAGATTPTQVAANATAVTAALAPDEVAALDALRPND